jgi:hypothetical protein
MLPSFELFPKHNRRKLASSVAVFRHTLLFLPHDTPIPRFFPPDFKGLPDMAPTPLLAPILLLENYLLP